MDIEQLKLAFIEENPFVKSVSAQGNELHVIVGPDVELRDLPDEYNGASIFYYHDTIPE